MQKLRSFYKFPGGIYLSALKALLFSGVAIVNDSIVPSIYQPAVASLLLLIILFNVLVVEYHLSNPY